jgi:hypothetical protein
LNKNAKYISKLQRMVCNLDLFGDTDRQSADNRINPMELGLVTISMKKIGLIDGCPPTTLARGPAAHNGAMPI